MSEELLRLEHLSIDYKVKDGYLSAVNDVNFSINKGEVFAVVGESGCGKSTVAHSIMNLLPGGNEEMHGEILFKGRDLRQCSQQEMEAIRGKEIGMIFQNPLDSLNPVYTVGGQIVEALELDKVDRVEAWNRVIQLFKDVKMPDAEERVKSFPHELSGGMRQRVMIAMALACNPKVIIADEPTTALDVTIQAQILDLLRNLKNKINSSIMLITHDLGVIAEMADYVVVMYAGRVVEKGTVQEIFANPSHPYTIGLMASKPVIGKKVDKLYSIPGKVPNPVNMPDYCYFRDRCEMRCPECDGKYPCEISLSETHKVSCYRYYDKKEGK